MDVINAGTGLLLALAALLAACMRSLSSTIRSENDAFAILKKSRIGPMPKKAVERRLIS
jgi:hypothetical protein